MKKSMKNRVAGAAAVLLAGSMAFSMTGCGSSSDNTAGQQTATDQKTEGNEVKISKVNSTVRLCGGIYSYMSGV